MIRRVERSARTQAIRSVRKYSGETINRPAAGCRSTGEAGRPSKLM
jgi:hypothetical protein